VTQRHDTWGQSRGGSTFPDPDHQPSSKTRRVRNSDQLCDLAASRELAARQRRANRALSRTRAGHLPANRMWMGSESDALRSSPGGSACPRARGKATEGRMSAFVAPREVLARLRRGVAMPQVKLLIGVSATARLKSSSEPSSADPFECEDAT
jgi:hypothetical protein